MEEINPTIENQLKELTKKELEFSSILKQAKLDKELVRTQILTLLAIEDIKEYSDSDVKLSYREQITRRLNKELLDNFLAQYGKTTEDFKTETFNNVLRVKSLNIEEGGK